MGGDIDEGETAELQAQAPPKKKLFLKALSCAMECVAIAITNVSAMKILFVIK